MAQCPKCSAENPPDSRFCNFCGQELSSLSQAPTVAAPEGDVPLSPANAPHVGRIVSSDSIPAGGFTPGTILADRYRIIGLLGRGGMGEVYRADDLKLGQPVALKFLPPKLAEDSVRRERFFAEVRITRQLSHPNICRVYDISEVNGKHFLSMEYIDGEDLASLMKRIGHLSNEKTLDIARQLVAGLSVAHERGVLHRDLKPANIMLDGHGRVRITDFGLAIAVGDESQAEEIAGTPAYMAPEQLAGKGATVRSDIYSLGLILYEIYTGKKAFMAKTLVELREQKETHTPRAPSEIREGIDPVVERVIQRCMEKDPNSRPTSVAQLAQALPGGDPLAAAIAAGETPSPEMVAASGSKEGLQPAIAWWLLAFIIIGTLAIIKLSDHVYLHLQIPFEKPPEALIEISKQFLNKAGYSEELAHSAYGFVENRNLLSHIEDSDKTIDQWKNISSQAILFWYRQSPRPLGVLGLQTGRTARDNPPLQHSGEVLVILDTEGHLVSFRSIPPQFHSKIEAMAPPNWDLFFSEAGLAISDFDEADTQWNPPYYADSITAWHGLFPNQPDVALQIKAASLQGKPISFEIMGPWFEEPYQPRMIEIVFGVGAVLICVPAIIGGLLFARRNLRLGRGDRRNATRVALFVWSLVILSWILKLPEVPFVSLLLSLYIPILLWILYLAFEPFIRRRWPNILVSWTRLFSGEWRDPLIARDALIGWAVGVLVLLLQLVMRILLPKWLGSEFLSRGSFNVESILGAQLFISSFLMVIVIVILVSLVLVCLLFILRILLRNQKVAFIVWVLIWALTSAPTDISAIATSLISSVLFLIVLMRFGLVGLAFTLTPIVILQSLPPATLYGSAWHSRYGFATLVILAAIVLYAFHTSLGGRPVFGTPRLDE